MELRAGLRLLREQWLLILVVALLATATSGLVTWRETPQYASQITIFVSAWGGQDDTASAYQGSLLSQQKVKSYTELLRTQHVMASVVDRLDLAVTPRELSQQVTSSAIPDTSLLTATVRDPSPEDAQQLATAIGEEFVALVPTLESVSGGQEPPVKVTVVSPAEIPTTPVSPRPARNLAVALLLGLLAGLGLAVARRALDTSVKSAQQCEEISGTPSLGTVPFDSGVAKRPVLATAPQGLRMEAFRKVRTSLQFVDVDRSHKVFVVTSAAPDEGKSLTTCNLAIALAEADKRVVVIDADLRRPSVARYLALPNGVGLTTVLLGRAGLTEVTQSWGDGRFAVLTSGPIPPNPTALLGSERMRELIDELRSAYDAVIIDSPPVLPVADAAVLAPASDGAVLVVRHGKTRHDQLRAAAETLQKAAVPVLGTVMNQAPSVRSAYYDYRYVGPTTTSRPEGAAQPVGAGRA